MACSLLGCFAAAVGGGSSCGLTAFERLGQRDAGAGLDAYGIDLGSSQVVCG